jgi:hypothetical protein
MYDLNVHIVVHTIRLSLQTVPDPRRLVAGVSPPRRRFDPSSVHVRSVGEKLALRQVLRRVVLFSPVIVIPSMLHTHIHAHVAVTRKTNRRSFENFQNKIFFQKSRMIG